MTISYAIIKCTLPWYFTIRKYLDFSFLLLLYSFVARTRLQEAQRGPHVFLPPWTSIVYELIEFSDFHNCRSSQILALKSLLKWLYAWQIAILSYHVVSCQIAILSLSYNLIWQPGSRQYSLLQSRNFIANCQLQYCVRSDCHIVLSCQIAILCFHFDMETWQQAG